MLDIHNGYTAEEVATSLQDAHADVYQCTSWPKC